MNPDAAVFPAAAPAPAPAAPAPVAAAPAVAAPAPAPVAPAAAAPKTPTPAATPAEEEFNEEDLDEETRAELEKLKMEEAQAEVEDKRENVNIVFIGHVDSGKSTISGQMLYLTGRVDKRVIEKYEREAKENNRESWWLAYVMDSIQEEKAKGKTIEVGRALFDTPSRRYTILDAPGHKAYVPNMIAGAAQADVAVLVISARKGEFESGFEKGGQTREHTQLAKTVGIRSLVVVVNKMDDLAWSRERYDEIVDKLSPFLRQSGYNPKKDVTFLPISGFRGVNMTTRVDPAVCPWYSGPCLLEVLDQVQLQHGREDQPFRLPVIDKYKDARGNTTVMGKIETGVVARGDSLVLMPTRAAVEVLAISTDDEARPMRTAHPGDNVRLTVKGEVAENIFAGYVACGIRPRPS
eukprot:m51a1_g11402 putative translation elongation factor ef1a initiation factor if2gamma family protein isoform 4 (408) ;mRNA; f:31020-33033